MMRIIVTGGVACGKGVVRSLLAKQFFRQGIVQEFDCDSAVGELLTDPDTISKLVELAGTQAVNDRGSVNRRWLREQIFGSETLRKSVEALLHPLVLEKCREFMRLAVQQDSFAAIVEVPLFFEVNFELDHDWVVVAAATVKTQLSRLSNFRNVEPAIGRKIIGTQLPIEQKMDRSDAVIWNEGSLAGLEEQISILARRISNMA